MGLFDLFKNKKQSEPIDFSAIGTDMHSHLIPGIDDGSKSMDDTIAMLAKFESLGYKKVIITPHVYSDYYKNSSETILNGLAAVQTTAKELGLSIQIEAAAEYFCDEYFMDLLHQNDVLRINEKYVLIEFPFVFELNNWKEYVFKIQSLGYTPIIAHFERYLYWHGSIETAKEMRYLGAKIQMNINSLTGHYGPDVKKQGERLIDAQLLDFIATDCHRIQHLLLMESKSNLPYLHKALQTNELLNSSL
jgi:protein-tyrosine phosphatase